MTHKSTWKKFESKVAKFFGAKRNPLSGSNSGQSSSDTLHPELYIEAKLREKWAIFNLFRDTDAKAKKEGKIPMLALAEKNKKGFLICCRVNDLDKIINEREILK